MHKIFLGNKTKYCTRLSAKKMLNYWAINNQEDAKIFISQHPHFFSKRIKLLH